MLQLTLRRDSPGPVAITQGTCACKAGSGNCGHLQGLVYRLCHFVKLGYKVVPPVLSKTSLPQTWHVPHRTGGLSSQPTDTLCISKVKPDGNQSSRKRRVIEGVLPTVYCPVKQPVPATNFAEQLLINLKSVNSDAQILKLLPNPAQNMVIPMSTSETW